MWISYGSLLEMSGSFPDLPTELESAFYQGPLVIPIHIEAWEAMF